jgi:putative holliday junction resolvase
VVVAADFGAKRVGLAASDATRTFVFPRGVVTRDAKGSDLPAIVALCRDEGARQLVVGLPLNVDGTEGDAARAAREYGARLASAAELPVAFVDERYTSLEAEEALRTRLRDPRERKARVDAAAATLILRTYLEHGPVE